VREKGLLIDATHGRKAKTAILFDTGHIILAAVSAETIAHRLETVSVTRDTEHEHGYIE
jgi:hypothetical protein